MIEYFLLMTPLYFLLNVWINVHSMTSPFVDLQNYDQSMFITWWTFRFFHKLQYVSNIVTHHIISDKCIKTIVFKFYFHMIFLVMNKTLNSYIHHSYIISSFVVCDDPEIYSEVRLENCCTIAFSSQLTSIHTSSKRCFPIKQSTTFHLIYVIFISNVFDTAAICGRFTNSKQAHNPSHGSLRAWNDLD